MRWMLVRSTSECEKEKKQKSRMKRKGKKRESMGCIGAGKRNSMIHICHFLPFLSIVQTNNILGSTTFFTFTNTLTSSGMRTSIFSFKLSPWERWSCVSGSSKMVWITRVAEFLHVSIEKTCTKTIDHPGFPLQKPVFHPPLRACCFTGWKHHFQHLVTGKLSV